MMEDSMKDELRKLDGVRYTTIYGSRLRVVFNHKAYTSTIKKVEDILDVEEIGLLAATQEHYPCAEYKLKYISDTE